MLANMIYKIEFINIENNLCVRLYIRDRGYMHMLIDAINSSYASEAKVSNNFMRSIEDEKKLRDPEFEYHEPLSSAHASYIQCSASTTKEEIDLEDRQQFAKLIMIHFLQNECAAKQFEFFRQVTNDPDAVLDPATLVPYSEAGAAFVKFQQEVDDSFLQSKIAALQLHSPSTSAAAPILPSFESAKTSASVDKEDKPKPTMQYTI